MSKLGASESRQGLWQALRSKKMGLLMRASILYDWVATLQQTSVLLVLSKFWCTSLHLPRVFYLKRKSLNSWGSACVRCVGFLLSQGRENLDEHLGRTKILIHRYLGMRPSDGSQPPSSLLPFRYPSPLHFTNRPKRQRQRRDCRVGLS
jgi:hypothetical protein